VAGLVAQSAASASPALNLLQYAVPLGAVGLALALLFAQRRPRPVRRRQPLAFASAPA
jgi:hypothetical protein